MSLTLELYSEKSFVVRGNIYRFQPELEEMGGKINLKLKGGEGVIFPLYKQKDVREYINLVNSQQQPLNKPKTPSILIEDVENGEPAVIQPLKSLLLSRPKPEPVNMRNVEKYVRNIAKKMEMEFTTIEETLKIMYK